MWIQMLAQCLVRKRLISDIQILLAALSSKWHFAGRELFPTSDCLKAGQREGMLIEEITQSGSDIICLQVSGKDVLHPEYRSFRVDAETDNRRWIVWRRYSRRSIMWAIRMYMPVVRERNTDASSPSNQRNIPRLLMILYSTTTRTCMKMGRASDFAAVPVSKRRILHWSSA